MTIKELIERLEDYRDELGEETGVPPATAGPPAYAHLPNYSIANDPITFRFSSGDLGQ